MTTRKELLNLGNAIAMASVCAYDHSIVTRLHWTTRFYALKVHDINQEFHSETGHFISTRRAELCARRVARDICARELGINWLHRE